MFKNRFAYLNVALILLFLLLCIFIIISNLKTAPIGNYFWDTLVFDGISYAIDQGLKPSIDFYATMIVPFYVRNLSNYIANGNFVEYIELWIYSIVLVFIGFGLLYKKVKPFALFIILGAIIIFMMFRINYGMVVSASSTPYLFNHAGSYNRFLDFLIMLIIFSSIPSPDTKTIKYLRIFIYSIVLLIGLYTKISTFAILIVLISSIMILNRTYKLLDIIAVYASTIFSILLIWNLSQIGSQYYIFLGDLGDFKSLKLQQELVDWRMSALFSKHIDDILILGVAIILFVRFLSKNFEFKNLVDEIFKKKKGRYLRISPQIYLLIIIFLSFLSILMFTLTNYGDFGFLPLIALFYVVRKTYYIHNLEISKRAKKYIVLLFLSFLSIYGIKLIKASFGHILYIANKNLIPLNDALNTLTEPHKTSYTTYKKYLVESNDVQILKNQIDITRNISLYENKYKTENFLAYIYMLNDINSNLDMLGISKNTKIYFLDFPAYYFAMTRGAKVPLNSYPFFLYDHELGKEFFPEGKIIFNDVDILITTTASLEVQNKRDLVDLYSKYIVENFEILHKEKYYTIYKKKVQHDGN